MERSLCFFPFLFFFSFYGSIKILFILKPGQQAAGSNALVNWECYATSKGK